MLSWNAMAKESIMQDIIRILNAEDKRQAIFRYIRTQPHLASIKPSVWAAASHKELDDIVRSLNEHHQD
jgi:hypothetical protein